MSKDPMVEHSARLLQALDFAQESADQTERHEREMRDLLLALLEVMDSFDRLRDPSSQPSAAATAGTVRLIAGQLESLLAGAGVEPVACLGKIADPMQHEIVEVQPADDEDDDLIVTVARRGWRWNGQPLRRPRVVVAQNTLEEEKS